MENPPYSPRLNPSETVWDMQKKHIIRCSIDSKEEVITESHEFFEEYCISESMIQNYKAKYMPHIK